MHARLTLSVVTIVLSQLGSIVGGETSAAVPVLTSADLSVRVGRPVDIASSAYLYRADRKPEENPPEAWILLMQYAQQPFNVRLDMNVPAIKEALCGLLWEEVRPLRRIELSWAADARNRPPVDDVVVTIFDGTDQTAHTWWNPRSIRQAGKPDVSADGQTLAYAIPVDTWGVIVSVRGQQNASAPAVPVIRAIVREVWKKMDVEIEWGFEEKRAALAYDGRLEAYDGVLADVRPLDGDSGTTMNSPTAWGSAPKAEGRRGIRFSMLYMGTSPWRRIWPYAAQKEDVARTILTVWTQSGNVSFLAADLENGPILAPEYGFFVRCTGRQDPTPAAREASLSQMPRDLLATKMDAIPGVPLIRGWASNVIPWLGVNPTDQPGLAGNLRIPAQCVAMHPATDRDVAVGWRSPIQGRVGLKARVAMGDSTGGNGIDWSVVLEGKSGRQVLAHGAIGTGGSQSISAEGDAKALGEVAVENGDMVALVIGPRGGNYVCDTTIVDLTVADLGSSGRTWSLTKEVVGDIHAGNPHVDAAGNAGVWHFFSTAPQESPPAPSEPPYALASNAATAREFLKELAQRNLKGIRQRTREHAEQNWRGAVEAMRGGNLPTLPQPATEPAMRVEIPCEPLAAQWELGAWHILRRSVRNEQGQWRYLDYPFGILASETYLILRALDLQGMHKEAADGLDQWLSLPVEHKVVAGQGGYHEYSLPDRPLGHFSDGKGCLTHAQGPPGVGGHMDGVHCMGPGAIMFALTEHYLLTGDKDWLKAAAPRIKANVEWILRQRQFLTGAIPGGQRLWSKGLQPAHVVTPDSHCMHMQFYESEAYYWLGVRRMADLLAEIDPQEGARLASEAEAYRKDLVAAIDRSIALTPVVAVRDGTYRSFVPFAPYVRGFAAGAWGWRRCQGHVGAIYWDTVQSADPLIDPSGLLSPADPRVQGHLDVLEDRLLLENPKLSDRTPGYDPEKHWFSHASWQYQCGLERHANIHLAADDVPNFLRSWLNQYAVDILPGEYTFREHTTGGPPDKSFEESAFLERFRLMLVMEDAQRLWLARATPRAWLGQGKRIAITNAPTHFGPVSYQIVSDTDHGRITATIDMPARRPPKEVFLRVRHPKATRIQGVTVNDKPWPDFDADGEVVKLHGLSGRVTVEARYAP